MSPSDYALKLQTTLKTSALVPGPADVLVPQNFTPTTALNVSFDGRALEYGNLFRARECKLPPAITFAPEVSLALSPVDGGPIVE